jgi:hypothetical protein
MKKIIFSFFASLLFLSQAANAEIKLGDKGSLGTIALMLVIIALIYGEELIKTQDQDHRTLEQI